jgi:hypothetical protein
MPKLLNRITSSLVVLMVLGASVLPGVVAEAAAAPTPAGQALVIAPPLIYLKVDPGQTKTAQIKIRDVSDQALTVTNEVNDFVAEGESGTPKVLLNESAPDPYSLKNWVTPLPQLQLQPHQIKVLTVTFNIPKNASPGGHYGVIRFTGGAPSLSGSGVGLSASIGSLVLLTVSGNIKESLSVKTFDVSKNGKAGSLFQSAPLVFTERINNTGNIHEQPTGLVTIKDMFGRKLATLPVNQPPGNILPASTRKFTQNLDKSVIGTKHLFGRYTAALSLTYGTGNNKTVTAKMSFWVIPFKTIGIVIVVLIIGFFALRYAIRRYNEAVVKRANRRR